ncbi:cytochrome P450 [Streptomyces tremellae]|uniref:Cytochrome P450 n=1 Tax=Streptomyces tremellae TaxID=1124239 RepID=A0ABP7FXH5_9ACTN
MKDAMKDAVREESAEAAQGEEVWPLPRRCPLAPPRGLAERLRTAPVARIRLWDGSSAWVVTRYDDVRAVLSDPRTSVDPRINGYPQVNAGLAAVRHAERSMLNRDDPEHAAVRRRVSGQFTVRKVEALRPVIQRVVDERVDDLLAGPMPADFVHGFALAVPLGIICELLGVPFGDRALFEGWTATMFDPAAGPARSTAASRAMSEYLARLVRAKKEDPRDDLLSSLAAGQPAAGAMTEAELANLARVLLIAGHETTAATIALGTLHLLGHPAQAAELREATDPALVAGAVEELLRITTVVQSGRRRVATADIELGGQLIRKGEGIVVAGDIANRDPAVFADPDTLDIHRGARHHVTFGYGVHQCLGQVLARAELQTVFGTLFRRIPRLALAVPLEELRFKDDMVTYGVHRMPVTW